MCCLNHGILCSIPLLMMSLQPPRFRKPQLTSDVLLTFENQRANCGFHSFQSESHFYEKVLKSDPQLGRDVQTRHQGQRTSCGMRILWPYQLYNRDSSGRGQVSEARDTNQYSNIGSCPVRPVEEVFCLMSSCCDLRQLLFEKQFSEMKHIAFL